MKLKRIVTVAAFALVAVSSTGGTAHAGGFGPPPFPPKVKDCTTVTVDPPNTTQTVTLLGTIGTHTVNLTDTIPFGGWVEHEASFDISPFTTATGVIDYALHSTWSLAPGDGPTVTGTMTCHKAPTTTTSTSTTSTTTSSTSTFTTSTTNPCDRFARGIALPHDPRPGAQACVSPTVPARPAAATLPRTGSSPIPAIVGLLCLPLGGAAIAFGSKGRRFSR
jgi:hypothetical protein